MAINIFIPILIAIGIGYALFSVFIQRKLSKVDKMYELRAHMSKKQKELMDMAKSNASKDAILSKQKELTDISMQSMKNQMKPMIVILPILAILEYFVLPNVFGSSGISISLLGFTLGYQLTFFVVIFVCGIALSISLSILDRKRLKDKYNFGLLQPTHKEPPQQTTQ